MRETRHIGVWFGFWSCGASLPHGMTHGTRFSWRLFGDRAIARVSAMIEMMGGELKCV